MSLCPIPVALRHNLADAMLDYADTEAETEAVAEMYRQDAQTLREATQVGSSLVVSEMVLHTAQSALVAKLAQAEEAANQARRDLANAERETKRYTALLNKTR